MITVYAQGEQAAQAGGGLFTLIYFAVIIAVFYFLLIRPQKKQRRALQNMIDSLQINDNIVTIGGVMGKVVTIKEDSVTIVTGADRTKITFEKSAIAKVLTIHE